MTINDKELLQAFPSAINQTHLEHFSVKRGKVRDIYDLGDTLLFVTTDRISAFDRNLTTIPYKGQVLNLISKYWFEQLSELVPNHLIDIPFANTMQVKKLEVFPIEFVVRGYITGSTNTSLWTIYQDGLRTVGGVTLPDGLEKNTKLPEPLLTPTTKSDFGDKPIEAEEIIAQGLMSQSDWDQASKMALTIFDYASEHVQSKDFILVDTKFEFGKDADGKIYLIDEVLTPDSSRYWRLSNFADCQKQNKSPDNFDKDIIRAWYKKNSDPYHDQHLPEAPQELRMQLAKTYIYFYEQLTGKTFDSSMPCLTESTTNIKL